MRSFKAIGQNGETIIISAYTESDARQKAQEALGYGNVVKFTEI